MYFYLWIIHIVDLVKYDPFQIPDDVRSIVKHRPLTKQGFIYTSIINNEIEEDELGIWQGQEVHKQDLSTRRIITSTIHMLAFLDYHAPVNFDQHVLGLSLI